MLDVGAGGGRLALPLALSCRSVNAVEPSPSMCAVLRETAEENGIDVGVVESNWADAQVEPADVVLCSHVIYVVEDIGAFVSKINSHARRLVLMVVFQSAPQSLMYQLWEAGARRTSPSTAQPASFQARFGRNGTRLRD